MVGIDLSKAFNCLPENSVKFLALLPQGSVLGPLLFNIFLNDLLLLPTNSNINSYADDTQLFLHGLNPITIK